MFIIPFSKDNGFMHETKFKISTSIYDFLCVKICFFYPKRSESIDLTMMLIFLFFPTLYGSEMSFFFAPTFRGLFIFP